MFPGLLPAEFEERDSGTQSFCRPRGIHRPLTKRIAHYPFPPFATACRPDPIHYHFLQNLPIFSLTTMLCSAQTARSGSNWLDRLRSNKGIPTGDDLDLDSFLLTVHSHSPQARPNNPPPARPSENIDQPMSTVLAELFNMGATLTKTSKKCPRKQTNPKIFLASSVINSLHDSAAATPSVDAAIPVEEEAAADRGDEEEVDNDKEWNEFKGFTKSEVTVIDTSCPGWKVDRLVFRRNNVWKVRERKPKSKFFAKKKSNSSTLVPHDLDINGIGTSKDNLINMRGEKPVKTQKYLKCREQKEIDVSRPQGSPDRSSKESRKENVEMDLV
ncbi:hypothetical protein VNO77_10014 [Canavalia gladiata]|uniref:Uncharacterized protein n=1 Tax=Canavalia gladiata TaxID=3824 RepID=A0AAN9R1S8_CANGL